MAKMENGNKSALVKSEMRRERVRVRVWNPKIGIPMCAHARNLWWHLSDSRNVSWALQLARISASTETEQCKSQLNWQRIGTLCDRTSDSLTYGPAACNCIEDVQLPVSTLPIIPAAVSSLRAPLHTHTQRYKQRYAFKWHTKLA